MKAHGNVIDPDELQLMDECNEVWVQSWKEVTQDTDVMKVLDVPRRMQENGDHAKGSNLVKS